VLYRGCSNPVVILDEAHQLRDPARVLKIGDPLKPAVDESEVEALK